MLGDFNQILHPNDKLGGADPNLNLINHCRNILNALHLSDLGYVGYNFTWKRGQVMERLDKDYNNQCWSLLFPNAYLYHLFFLQISDHCPIQLFLGNDNKKPKKRLVGGSKYGRLSYQVIMKNPYPTCIPPNNLMLLCGILK